MKAFLFFLSFAFLLCGCYGAGEPGILTNSTRIYTGGNILSIGLVSTTCTSSLIIQTNTSQCMTAVDAQGTYINSTCLSTLQNASFVSCTFATINTYCLAINPIAKTISPFIAGNVATFGRVSTSYGSTTLTNPVRLTTTLRSFYIDALVVDKELSSTVFLASWMYTGTIATFRSIINFTNTQPVADIAFATTTTFFIAFAGDTTISLYNTSGALQGTVGTFGNVQRFARDFSGRLFVYDLSCPCIKILDPNGVWYKTIVGVSNVAQISVSRNYVFVLDNVGVTRYYEDFTFVSVVPVNVTCVARGGSVTATVQGGALPYTYNVFPDRKSTSSSNTTFTTGLATRTRRIPAYTIYGDTLSNEFTDMYTSSLGKRVLQTPASDFPPRSGLYSYSMQMVSRVRYGFRGVLGSVGLINATAFQSIEMWINVGDGGQFFQIDLGTAANTFTFGPGDFANNTWQKFSIDLSVGTNNAYSQLYITDLSGNLTGNTIYLDDVVMRPYTTTQRTMEVTDFCGVVVTSPNFTVSTGNVLAVNITSSPTSCSSLGHDGLKGFDGTLTAKATGGFGPYQYAWSFTEDMNETIGNLGAFQDDIVIYDNEIRTPFSDASSTAFGRNLSDATYFHSAPYSFSMAPQTNLESWVFNFPSLVDATDYRAVEFWVNGGAVGQQMINVKLSHNADTVGTQYTIARLLGYPSIPPNTWMKVTYPIASTVTTFTGVIFTAIGNWEQPRIYFDDLTLIGADYIVTVNDTTGCPVVATSISIQSPGLIGVRPDITNAKCFGSSDGQVALQVTGGTAPYSYSWANPNNNVMTGLARSVFLVNVSDSKTCTSPFPVEVSVLHPPPLHIGAYLSHARCYGTAGVITATTYGGVAPFTYSWSGTPAPILTPQLAPSVVFEDSFQNWWDLNSPNVASQVVCNGADYAWASTNESRASHTGYCAIRARQPSGSSGMVFSAGCIGCVDTTRYTGMQMWVYLVNPSDIFTMNVALYKSGILASTLFPLANASTFDTSIVGWQKVIISFATAKVALADYVTITTSSTNMGNMLIDDVVLLPVSTGTLSSGYLVNTGFVSVMRGSATAYTLTVTDANGCSTSASFELREETEIKLEASPDSSGKIRFNATGGVPPYTFYIENVQVNGSEIEGIPEGTHKVAVVDANGCPKNETVVVPGASTSNTAMLAGIISGVAVVILGISGAAGLFVYRQRQQAVKALVDVEEGERRAYKIDFSALEIGAMIGAGSFGEVFSGDYKGADVAIKKLKTQQMTKQQIDEFARESAVMVGLRHPNILLFMGVCLEPSNLCIVTELCPRGNLSEILHDKDIKLPYQLLFKMALDTIKGLQFIHGSGFVHRDLKSPNLLVDKYWCIKIADFGLSVAKHQSNDEAQVSLLWTAPEILSREKDCYSFASDIYSFGIILWELMSKNTPWEGVQPAAITSKVVGGQRPPLGEDWDEAVKRLIQASWAQSPTDRPTIKQLRSTMESEIIPMVGDIEMGSSTYDNSFTNKESTAVALQAPPPQPPFAIVCATVSGSTQLWESDPRAMCVAMQGLYDITKDHALKLSGYEINRDAPILYGFGNPTNAINFCLQIQLALREFAWPASLLSYSEAREVIKNGDVVQRGLRVRMAVHWGTPSLRKEANTNRAIYVGPSMQIAAALPKYTQGGTTVLDQEMYNKLMSPAATLETDPFAINPLGAYQVEGKSVHLFKVVPATLKALLDEELETLGGAEEDDLREPWLADFEDVKLEGVIGKGTFGEVYSATWKGETVAAKKFVQQKVTGQLMLEMRTECAILRKLQHPNIIQFEGMCLQPPNLLLMTELMGRGALSNIIYSNVDLPWSRRLDFARQIANGLAYLHKNEIIHRDVKSSNLLVATDWTVKIADFGFSRIKDRAGTMTQCGTVAWTAPEIFDGSHYTEKADVYSYAVVLWELIFRKKPWVGRHAMKVIQTVETGGRLATTNMPLDTPQVLSKLMVDCWEQVPDRRPSFLEIIETLRNV